MPKDNQSDPRKHFVPRFLPCLLGGAMLVVYWLTLNHWVTLANVSQVAAVSGWMWQPQIFNPLVYLATLPFHLLPVAQIPIALNLFAAVCAAATLAVLARSVAILPHDRTEMERTRERSDFAFLTGWAAWAPPVVAVFFGGLQLGFWKNATSFTGESFQLLWFAIIVWQLLEYRLDERPGRLYLAAFLYGAGITDNWALVPFIPLFLMMIIWLRKLDFFNLNFLVGMTVCGLAGMLLLFLLPLLAKFDHVPFWEAVRANLKSDWMVAHMASQSGVRRGLLLMSLTSLFPAFVMSIRWSATFGDSSQLGAMLVNYLMHVVNAVIFGILIWVTFDPPFSPYQLSQSLGAWRTAPPALSLYYVTALCIGYYCGYALLIFGQAPVPTRRNTRPEPAVPEMLLWLCPVIVAVTLAAVGVMAGLLIYKNGPAIRTVNDDSLLKYAEFTAQGLPRDHAILLSDPDENQSVRPFLLQAVLAREGRAKDYPVVDTQSLNWVPYHTYLHKQFPKYWPQSESVTNDNIGVSNLRIFVLLGELSKSNNLCYLNPSYGYYFEQFYLEPHGLVYSMKPLPGDNLLPPVLDKNLMAENESFWTKALSDSRPAIENAMHPRSYNNIPGVLGWMLQHLHITAEANPNALVAGTIYSRSLNFLGVKVQRAGELEKASALFSEAVGLNTNNVVAAINLDFNKALRRGSPTTANLSRVTTDQFGKYRDWNSLLSANGPFDETSFCFEYGFNFMQIGQFRQAADSFNRVRQLAPDNLATRLFLAQIYILTRLPDAALEALRDPLTHPLRFALTEYNTTELAVLAAAAHFQKKEDAESVALLDAEIERHPDDETLMFMTTQSYLTRGLYTNALQVINRKLARAPNDLQWTYGKGFASLQIGAYDDAVAAFNRILVVQTNNLDVLFNRAIAYLQSGRLDAAREDYRRLQADHPNAFQIAYGLAEVAWRRHETNEAVRNYQIYIANAPTNSVEFKTVRERLTELHGK